MSTRSTGLPCANDLPAVGVASRLHHPGGSLLTSRPLAFLASVEDGAGPAPVVGLDDAALLERARRASNDMFARLWAGDWSPGYPSPSEADLALANLLAFWTGRDAERMDRLFRQSRLFRPKWDERRGATGGTYGRGTIDKAIASCRETYSPRPPDAPPPSREPDPQLIGVGLGEFLALEFPDHEPLIEGILAADGNGWIGGEEKLGKSYYAADEGLGLALAQPVAGRFSVPLRRRVLFVEEEDPPRRTHIRLKALLRGRGLDPDDVNVRRDLDSWFRIHVWSGFSLDDSEWVARLDVTCAEFQPAVVYLDVLRKITARDLNKADQAGALLGTLDVLRRKYGVIFRIIHHYRKSQGFRVGRGSQEIGGSFVLGAWGECSLFFEPVGRKQGQCRVEVQVKDGPPVPGFRLAFYAEGPHHAPTLVRLTAEDEAQDESADDVVLQAIATLPKAEATVGRPGVTIKALSAALKKGDKTIRRVLKRLQAAGLVLDIGKASKHEALYGVPE